jgi:hypothetical protein
MPHHPKPFFKSSRNTWSVQVGPAQHSLGRHIEGTPPPKKRGVEWDAPREILDACHAEMAELQHPETIAAVTASPAVATVLNQFIGWLQGRVAEGSKANYAANQSVAATSEFGTPRISGSPSTEQDL